MADLRVDSSEKWDDAIIAEVRAFIDASIFDRAPLHASLECPPVRKRSRLLRATDGSRIVGVAAIVEAIFPFRSVPLAVSVPRAVPSLLRRVEPPFVALGTQPLWDPLIRCGGVCRLEELQMVRMRHAPLPEPDPRVERLDRLDELRDLIGPRFSPVHFETGPFLGARDSDGVLVACGGAMYVTECLAQIGYIETRPDRRGEGLARAIVAGLVREIERPDRRVVLHVGSDNHDAIRLYADLGFRGRIRSGLFTFEEGPRSGSAGERSRARDEARSSPRADGE